MEGRGMGDVLPEVLSQEDAVRAWTDCPLDVFSMFRDRAVMLIDIVAQIHYLP
jgi:hypothetical protein